MKAHSGAARQPVDLTAYRTQLAERLHDEQRLQALDRAPHEGPWRQRAQMIAEIAGQMLRTEIAEVNLVSDTHMHCVASAMSDAYSIDVGDSYCQHVVATGATVVVYDATSDTVLSDHPAAAQVRCYLGIPLTHRGQVLGALCVAGTEPRTWSDVEIAMLTELTETLLSAEGWVA